jgi:hypothetical protein
MEVHMTVKMLVAIAGADFSYYSGQEIELDAETEKRLVESGQAEKVKSAPAKKKTSKK